VALGNPVGSGLVASLARPGGNVTGLSTQAPDFAGKKVELLREVIPTLRHLAVLVDFSNDDRLNSSVTDEVRAAARTVGIEVVRMEIRRFADIAHRFGELRFARKGNPAADHFQAKKVYYGPVYFRRESEAYMTLAVAGTGHDRGVGVAEVNLYPIWGVV